MKESYTYIDTNKAMRNLVHDLAQSSISEIGLDLEGDYNRHRYGMRLCLVQIFDGQQGYLIDPFKVNAKYIKQIFTNDQTKVMFAPGSDLMLVQNTLDCTITNVIDLQLAAQMIDPKGLSLTEVLKKTISVEIPAKKKFQRANWNKRPLTDDFLEYAFSDVVYLFQARDALFAQLHEKGLYEEFVEKNQVYQTKDYTIDPKTRHLRVKRAKSLSRKGKIYLKSFFECREKIAKKRDISPNMVMENETLIHISKKPPKNKGEWAKLKGTSKNFGQFIDAFDRAKLTAEKQVPQKFRGKKNNRSEPNKGST